MTDGIILAGGKSTRMKTNKMLLQYKGHPLIWHTIHSISPFVDRVIIVTGRYDRELREALKDEEVIFVYNKNYESGMFSSVQTGIKESKGDFFIVPGDCPFIKKETFIKILNGKGDIRVPQHNGEDGHPIFFKSRFKEEILSCPLDFNLKRFRDSQNYEIINVEDSNIAINLNNLLDFNNLNN